jgi:ribosomal protein S18 acetylase RimI-like enzyme
MIPFTPSLSVRTIHSSELAVAAELINGQLAQAVYSAPMALDELSEQLFSSQPATLHPVRWQQRCVLGAWRAGAMVGLLDVAAGQDNDSTHLPDYKAVGLVRFAVLPSRQELVDDVAQALWESAESFWRSNRVVEVKAFHISTGYPSFQAGAGILPGDWPEHVRLLTNRGFTFVDRYYCMMCTLGTLLEEAVPQGGLSLAFRGTREDRRYQVFYRRTEMIAEARLVQRIVVSGDERLPIGYLAHWEVEERWRNQKIGRWLLRRAINDAAQQGLAQLVLHIKLNAAAAMNLLAQHGFVEQNYRGYTFGRHLTA